MIITQYRLDYYIYVDVPPPVPRRILKNDYQGGVEADEAPGDVPLEVNMQSPPALPPPEHPDPPGPPSTTPRPTHTVNPGVFYNPTVKPRTHGDAGMLLDRIQGLELVMYHISKIKVCLQTKIFMKKGQVIWYV